MRLNILLSVIVLGNVAVFSVGLKWSGREDSDSEKVASATGNGGEWQVAGRPRKGAIAKKLAEVIFASAAGKLRTRASNRVRANSQFGFLYLNYDLNEKAAVLEDAIANKMPAYSINQPPTMILGNLYISEVDYRRQKGQTVAHNYGHAEDQLLSLFKNNDDFYNNGCPFFVIVGTRLPPCGRCAKDIRTTRDYYRTRTGCESTFYVFIGNALTLLPV